MFEFKMSYKDPDFHKPEDPPFIFPPKGIDSKLDANLVEIEGGNGTGKTTLLNCLALAFGYAEHEKNLDQDKPMLARKLRRLEENPTLSYCFRIGGLKHETGELMVERKEGQRQQCWLNGKPIDLDLMANKLDVVFLTEDDPKKVVSASLGKLSGYFKVLDTRLTSIQETVTRSLMDIRDFSDFKKREKGFVDEIEECDKEIKKAGSKIAHLKEGLRLIQERDAVGKKIELLRDEKQIISRYESTRRDYEKLRDKEEPELVRKLSREKMNLTNADIEIRGYNSQIIRICDSLKHYGTSIDGEKLVDNDFAEFNELKRSMSGMKEKAVKMKMVDEMMELFEHYSDEEMVPLVDKTVRETVNALLAIKRSHGDDRVFGLFSALEKTLDQRMLVMQNFDKINEKIGALSQKIKNLEHLEDTEQKFSEAEKRYLDLQKALKEGRIDLFAQWSSLCSVEGDSELVQDQLHKLEIQLQSEERVKIGCEQKLRILQENAARKPKYVENEKELRNLNDTVAKLRENIYQWTRILDQPEESKRDFASFEDRPGFGASDYQMFIKALGEFLGNRFEPLAFNFRLHEIKFFDIENNTFVTKEDRRIPIDDLSQGQSKVATLRKIFKEMDPNRKKIVLIDEIADLDPENLQFVKNTLKDKFSEGSLLLAVLVRPTHEASAGLVEIKGWG